MLLIFDIKSCRIKKGNALECSFKHIVNKSCFIESLLFNVKIGIVLMF